MEAEVVSMVEGSMQEEFRWEMGVLDDMCEGWGVVVRQGAVDLGYSDQHAWKRLDPWLVETGEREELDRSTKMGVHEYVHRDKAISDQEGKIVRVKWARINQGTDAQPEVRCRLVTQELGYGERLDELFARTPTLIIVELLFLLLLPVAAVKDSALMLLDAKCAFLYGAMIIGGVRSLVWSYGT